MNEILQKRIEEAAHEYIQSDAVAPENMQIAFGDFINGAKWALQNQWISVDEALPEEEFDDGYEFVLVIVKEDEETLYYDTDYISNGKWELHNSDKVTHWMPIPPLKGVEK